MNRDQEIGLTSEPNGLDSDESRQKRFANIMSSEYFLEFDLGWDDFVGISLIY